MKSNTKQLSTEGRINFYLRESQTRESGSVWGRPRLDGGFSCVPGPFACLLPISSAMRSFGLPLSPLRNVLVADERERLPPCVRTDLACAVPYSFVKACRQHAQKVCHFLVSRVAAIQGTPAPETRQSMSWEGCLTAERVPERCCTILCGSYWNEWITHRLAFGDKLFLAYGLGHAQISLEINLPCVAFGLPVISSCAHAHSSRVSHKQVNAHDPHGPSL